MADLNELLKKKNPQFSNLLWEVKNTKCSGQGLFATKNIAVGEIIFNDVPIVVGPRMTGKQLTACIVCYNIKRPLRNCAKNCHLPVCSSKCENSSKHDKECKLFSQILITEDSWSLDLYQILTPLRCLLVKDNDRTIIEKLHANSNESVQKQLYKIKKTIAHFLTESDEKWMEHCCGVLNSTAFEVMVSTEFPFSIRGLYPVAAIMNHDCSPNARHYYAKRDPLMMTVVATKRIAQGEEITNNYCPLLWATRARRIFLHITKEFLCNCSRCQDPTEFGSYLSAFLCKCGDSFLPISPLEFSSKWQCNNCSSTLTPLEVSQMQSNGKQSTDEMEPILHPSNAISIQNKMEMIRLLGERLHVLSTEELNMKEKYVKEMLLINDKLMLGDSRTKGILSLALYKTLKEKQFRNMQFDVKELEVNLRRAKSILENDNSAPRLE